MIHAESVKQWEAESNDLRAEIARLQGNVEALRKLATDEGNRIVRLRAALGWYVNATRDQYIQDDGTRARKALARDEEKC